MDPQDPEPPTQPRSRLVQPPDPSRPGWQPDDPVGSTPWYPSAAGRPAAATSTAPPTWTGPRRRRRWLLVGAALVVVLVAGAIVGVVALSSDGSTSTGTRPVAASPRASGRGSASPSSTAGDTAVDAYARTARTGDCVALLDALDGKTDVPVRTAACTDASATFTVVAVNDRIDAKRPCRTADTVVRAENAGLVLCLRRVLQVGQCILGNGAEQFPLSAVVCSAAPAAPFTQVLRVARHGTSTAPVTCAAPQILLTLSNENACLVQVG